MSSSVGRRGASSLTSSHATSLVALAEANAAAIPPADEIAMLSRPSLYQKPFLESPAPPPFPPPRPADKAAILGLHVAPQIIDGNNGRDAGAGVKIIPTKTRSVSRGTSVVVLSRTAMRRVRENSPPIVVALAPMHLKRNEMPATMDDAKSDDGEWVSRRPASGMAALVAVARPDTSASERDSIDRSNWISKALADHPEIDSLLSRLAPFDRAASLCDAIDRSGYRPPTSAMSRGEVLRLVIEHLRAEGLHRACKELRHELRESGMVLGSGDGGSEGWLLGVGSGHGVDHVTAMWAPPAETRLSLNLQLGLRASESAWSVARAMDGSADSSSTLSLAAQNRVLRFQLGLSEQSDGMWSREGDMWTTFSLITEVIDNNSTPTVIAGSLNAIIHYLCESFSEDSTFRAVFLTTFPGFISPRELLAKLINRFHGTPSMEPPRLLQVRNQVCRIVRAWIVARPIDFDESMVAVLSTFLFKTLTHAAWMDRQEAVSVKAFGADTSIQKSESEKTNVALWSSEIYEAMVKSRNRAAEEEAKRPTTWPVGYTVEYSSHSRSSDDIWSQPIPGIARELTLLAHSIYSAIQPCELLDLAWSSPKLVWRAPYMVSTFTLFNAVSMWVATSILGEELLANRARRMGQFIALAQELFNLKNLLLLSAINSGLSMLPTGRLSFTRAACPGADDFIKQVDSIFSAVDDFNYYRKVLTTLLPPCVPFLGVFQRDLVYQYEAMTRKTVLTPADPERKRLAIHPGLINMRLYYNVYTTISSALSYQGVHYKDLQSEHSPALATLVEHTLRRVPMLSSNEMFALSVAREPKKATLADIK